MPREHAADQRSARPRAAPRRPRPARHWPRRPRLGGHPARRRHRGGNRSPACTVRPDVRRARQQLRRPNGRPLPRLHRPRHRPALTAPLRRTLLAAWAAPRGRRGDGAGRAGGDHQRLAWRCHRRGPIRPDGHPVCLSRHPPRDPRRRHLWAQPADRSRGPRDCVRAVHLPRAARRRDQGALAAVHRSAGGAGLQRLDNLPTPPDAKHQRPRRRAGHDLVWLRHG